MDEPGGCTYELDDKLRITWVDDAWSEFARANGAPQLAFPSPLGTSILAGIADPTSSMLYEQLFRKVLESGTPVVLPFRCDSPTRRRFLNLVVRPRRPEGGLRIETILQRVEARAAVQLLDPGARRDNEMLRMCGWCKCVDMSGSWREVEDVVSELRLFERDALPAISHGICPECFSSVAGALDGDSG